MAEGIERAGQFKIERADIITSAGLVQDIIGNIVGITIYESIGRSAISGDITFHDSFGFSNIGPLIGQEFLALKISTPTIYNAEDTIDFSHEVLHIRRVTDKKYAVRGFYFSLDPTGIDNLYIEYGNPRTCGFDVSYHLK